MSHQERRARPAIHGQDVRSDPAASSIGGEHFLDRRSRWRNASGLSQRCALGDRPGDALPSFAGRHHARFEASEVVSRSPQQSMVLHQSSFRCTAGVQPALAYKPDAYACQAQRWNAASRDSRHGSTLLESWRRIVCTNAQQSEPCPQLMSLDSGDRDNHQPRTGNGSWEFVSPSRTRSLRRSDSRSPARSCSKAGITDRLTRLLLFVRIPERQVAAFASGVDLSAGVGKRLGIPGIDRLQGD